MYYIPYFLYFPVPQPVEKCIQFQLIQTEYTAKISEYKTAFHHDLVTIGPVCIQTGLETAPSLPKSVLHPETVIIPFSWCPDRKCPQPSQSPWGTSVRPLKADVTTGSEAAYERPTRTNSRVRDESRPKGRLFGSQRQTRANEAGAGSWVADTDKSPCPERRPPGEASVRFSRVDGVSSSLHAAWDTFRHPHLSWRAVVLLLPLGG